ncbi:cytochrome c oxidase subunit 3 [Emticicia sp. 21SJ11W-3]|uniref:cytochrome c oxidase subunit 3 n=1 Tax=Emticicia sp. 21SJ11W-3 TaxID=2916755 RepID=UPI00209E4F13|nr:cytochrome c oxidase subunit 3 [Emticicia sp. 21SJ11W-3]UTA67737.1 cytochrome c oxidase subunit 3 [Emticicia sp. 21SJ11W-3]
MLKQLTKRREPFAFMLYLFIVSSGLLFFFIILVFISKEAASGVVPLKIPGVFWGSTAIILVSSSTLHWANKAFREERFRSYRLNISLTLACSVIFLILQGLGWKQMLESGITMSNNTGGMFIYILSGLHLLHALGGIVALGFANRDAFKRLDYVESYVYSVNPPNQLKLKLISIYWHFIDILWILLFLFLLYHAAQNPGNSH